MALLIQPSRTRIPRRTCCKKCYSLLRSNKVGRTSDSIVFQWSTVSFRVRPVALKDKRQRQNRQNPAQVERISIRNNTHCSPSLIIPHHQSSRHFPSHFNFLTHVVDRQPSLPLGPMLCQSDTVRLAPTEVIDGGRGNTYIPRW